jgi:hypothetical protein
MSNEPTISSRTKRLIRFYDQNAIELSLLSAFGTSFVIGILPLPTTVTAPVNDGLDNGA